MTTELSALQERLEQLESEVTLLRRREAQRRGRFQMLGLGALVAGILVATAPRATTQTLSQDIVCRSLRIVDNRGNERGVIGVNVAGGFLALRGNSGNEQVFTGINEAGGFSSLYDNNRRERVFIGTSGTGGPRDTGVVEFNRGQIR